MIRVALLGAGRMGEIHGRNAAANPRIDFAWIVDPNLAQASALAAATGARAVDPEEVLADDRLDAVIIATPASSHLPDVLGWLWRGKAVFCEKPLALSCAELEAQAKLFGAAGCPPLFVGFNRRFDPHFGELKARLVAREAGALESLHLINHDPVPPPHGFIPRSGGLFRDFTIHDFDTAAWLLGSPVVELFATASCLVDPVIGELGDVDTARVLLRARSGALCVISNSRRSGCGYDQRIEAFCSDGALRVDNMRPGAVVKMAAQGERRPPIPFAFPDRYADAYRLELDHFVDVVEQGATPCAGYAESYNALWLAEAAERSVRTNAPVRLEQGDLSG